MTTTNPDKQTMTVREIADLLGYGRLPDLGDDSRSDELRRVDQTSLMLEITDGTLDEPGQAEQYRDSYTDRATLLRDVAVAKEWAYGFGSTPPVEIAEAYGWTSREHQDAELRAQQRRRILGNEVGTDNLPWDDPNWYRSIARRYNIAVNIPDDPDIRLLRDDEALDGDTGISAVAYAAEESGLTRRGAAIRVSPKQAAGMTREEIENAIAHEMIHTIMRKGVGHGPDFMKATDERNIGVTASKRELRRVEDADPLTPKHEQPFAGGVVVYPSQGHQLNIDPVSGNDPRLFKQAQYRLLSEPGDEGIREEKLSGRLPINQGSPGYFLPGTALSRHWGAFDSRPDYWEIGTVQPNGTVKWDCLTYIKPDDGALEDYAREGYCPPELEENEIQPLEHQRQELINAVSAYEPTFTRDGPTDSALWGSMRLAETSRDNTLTVDERKNLIFWLATLDKKDLAMESQDDSSLTGYTRLYNLERDRLIANRSPETIAEIQEGLRGKRERRLAAPERPQLVGEGTPLRLPITYDTADIPEERLVALRGAIDDYQESRPEKAGVGYSDHGSEYRGVPRQATYKQRHGRGNMMY